METSSDPKQLPRDYSSQDLFFGILAPIGSDKDAVTHNISKTLIENFGYRVETLRLSKYIKEKFPKIFPVNPQGNQCKFCDMRNKILYGTRLRKVSDDPAILAKLAVADIRTLPTTKPNFGARDDGHRRAFIFDQLKRREEIDYLSNLYGKSFFLVGIHSPTDQRLKELKTAIGRTESLAQELMELDQSEKEYFKSMSACPHCRPTSEIHSPMSEDGKTDFGQQLRDIFSESDLFVSDRDCEREISRFIDLIFGSPKEFPSSSDHAMFLAFSASTRSADLSRQVGAAVLNSNGDLISVGSNDVPRAGGGIYDYSNHKNDLALGYEANSKRLYEIAGNVTQTLISEKMLEADSQEKKEKIIQTLIDDSELGALTEFHRTVHAEMQALLSAVRSGVTTKGGSIFVTTFPCHNCAKHIVSSGILNIYFVEPYPKSLAQRLHQDALAVVEDGSQILDRVAVRPYLGVGPRRFHDLFSLKLSTGAIVRRKAGFAARDFDRTKAKMRFASVISPADLERSAEKIFLADYKEKLIALKRKMKDKAKFHDEAIDLLTSLAG